MHNRDFITVGKGLEKSVNPFVEKFIQNSSTVDLITSPEFSYPISLNKNELPTQSTT